MLYFSAKNYDDDQSFLNELRETELSHLEESGTKEARKHVIQVYNNLREKIIEIKSKEKSSNFIISESNIRTN